MSEKVKTIFEWLFFVVLILVIASNYNNNSEIEDKLDDIQSSIELLSVDVDEVKTKCDELEFELRWK